MNTMEFIASQKRVEGERERERQIEQNEKEIRE